MPATNRELATIREFLTLVADGSEADGLVIAQADELLRLDRQLRAAKANHEFWRTVLLDDFPENVTRLVRVAAERAGTTSVELAARIQAMHEQSSIESAPWLKLLREVQSLPLLQNVKTGELIQAFVALLNMLKLFVPATVEQIRDDMSKGGFSKVRERLAQLLDESRADGDDEDNIIEVEQPVRPPGKLPRAEWERIAKFSTQTEAAEHTGYDPKTINKYLQKYSIPNPWRAQRRN